MAPSFNEDIEEGPSKHVQQRAEKQNHNFQFRFKSETDPVFVDCDTSMTVLDALNTSDTFKMNEDVKNTKKEMVIQRADGAAVKTDFPCCLIEKDEILDITFIKEKGKASMDKKPQADLSLPRTDLVTFRIKTTGQENMIHVMKNSELKSKADYVCVFAFKDEEVKTALERDGRFIDKIFQKHCVLSLESKDKAKKGEKTRYEMSISVDHLDKKIFQIIADDRRSVSQKKPTKTSTEPNVASAADSEKNEPGQHPTDSEQKTIQERKKKSAGPSAKGQPTQNTSYSDNSISTEIKDILQTQCKVLLEMLQKPENSQVKLYQEEYNKSLQNFTDVKSVKRATKLSDSVCVIRFENSPRGTGFLLFDRFILTNAHVVKDYVYSPPEAPHKRKLFGTLTAVFNYEVLPVKYDIVAYRFEKEEKHTFHDFALLELEAAPYNCTELIENCKHGPSPKSGGIYIVGHPGCEVKKMNPCFIIGIEDQLQSINKHISENVSCPYVSWHCWPYLYKNQITYDSCFFHGSSGSPVFDEHCYLIGMHTGGYDYKEGETTRSFIEFSYSMQPILESIITQVKTTRSDILKLLSKFEPIGANYNLGNIEHACGANMPIKEEQESEVEKMEQESEVEKMEQESEVEKMEHLSLVS